jgi:glutamyl aminopeptidase
MVHFAETVPMSTYLACFIISDFKYTKRSFDNNDGTMVPFRFYATPAQINKTIFAGEFGKEVMEHYIRYFNVSFPLPKLGKYFFGGKVTQDNVKSSDMVAIPDFQSGGMENWGLVTFREAVLLYDVAIHSEETKQTVAVTVAHELSHSWFGNLGMTFQSSTETCKMLLTLSTLFAVTMKWWDDTWLNKGFATYISFKGIEKYAPEWKIVLFSLIPYQK